MSDDGSGKERVCHSVPRCYLTDCRHPQQRTNLSDCRARFAENLNRDIGELVKRGLPAPAQKALDVVRVTGNNLVHPGQIEVGDDPTVVDKLFKLVNIIVEKMVADLAELEALFDKLPPGQKEPVARRDGSK